MATGNPIGKVTLIQGQVTARSSEGKTRVLKLGDTVFEGEVLMTAKGARVEIGGEQGGQLLVREKETVTLDKSIFGVQDDVREVALLDRVKEGVDVARAIAEGSSLDALLEETAAGLDGGGGDNGHA